MLRVFDCFTFFDELDLLEIRLHELSDVVDRFVISEATSNFAGDPKPLHFSENRRRFSAFTDRIVHVVVDFPSGMRSRWDRETYQRNALLRGLGEAAPDDLVVLSDIDEIPRAEAIRSAKNSPPGRFDVQCFELRMYNYFFNFESGERWLRSGPRAVRRRHLPVMERLRKVKGPVANPIQNAIRALRNSYEVGRPTRRITLRDAGWHFTYLGGVEEIQKKIRARAGRNSKKDILDPDYMDARIREGLATNPRLKTRLTYRPLDGRFPRYLVENRERFAQFILSAGEAHDVADAANP